MMKDAFNIAILATIGEELGNLNWKAIIIVCTVGSLVIGTLLAIKKVAKQMLDEEDGTEDDEDKKKGGK